MLRLQAPDKSSGQELQNVADWKRQVWGQDAGRDLAKIWPNIF